VHRIQRSRHALACALALVGCAHLPESFDSQRQRAVAAPASAAVASAPSAPVPAGASAEPAPSTPAAPPTPESFADLFERMRSGFTLPEIANASVEREIAWYQGRPAYVERSFGRGRRYLHYIVEVLEARDMPRELALLPVVESAFDPFAFSRARASGLWQFIPSTGRLYGLGQDGWSDDRRDVLQATSAALDHLQDLHAEFAGDWLLALAAYNAGSARVSRAIERNVRQGRPTDFFALDLPAETRAYVPKLLAISRLVAEPESFGLDLPEIPNAPYFARVDVRKPVDLRKVADLASIPRDELRALNPAFNRWATAPDGRRHLLVPATERARLEQVLASIPAYEEPRVVQRRVKRGDTLASIARRHKITVADLRAANRLRGSLIRPGQILRIPVRAAEGDRRSPA